MVKDTLLLIIDPQNDFCDLPASYLPVNPLNTEQKLTPQLPVPGAHADMHRLAQFIRSGKSAIKNIMITLDSHHHIGIERPGFWRRTDGADVAPFTTVTATDVRQGKYAPRDESLTDQIVSYLDALEAAGRYTHMIWPIHCEMGTWGHNVHADVIAACNAWEVHHGRPTEKLFKGTNPHIEHYSILRAEVPDPDDPATQLNEDLLARLQSADTLLVAGEAGSHCVKATLEHYAHYAAADALARVVLLTDCMSPITGFEDSYQAFLDDMQGRGVTLTTTKKWLQSY